MPKTGKRSAVATPHTNDNRNADVGQGIKTMHNIVMEVLTTCPPTRSSDRILIAEVYRRYYGIYGDPFYVVMTMSWLPSFETITRCRRKIQEEHEELRADDPVETERINRQMDFIEYARGDAYV